MQPLVSIIITSYNYEKYLRQAIDSALGQTYRQVEVIVVDDGSTDTSPEIIRSYGDRIIPLFRSNGGQAAAQNSGFRVSSGDIVLILDSDDYLLPEAIDAIVGAWKPGTAKAQFYLKAVNAEGRELGELLPNLPMLDGDMRHLVECYGYYPAPPTSGNAYDRRVLEKLLPMEETTWKRGPDGLLNALSALYGDIVSVHRPLGCYRIHGTNMYSSQITLPLIRANMQNEIDREIAIRAHLERLGRPPPRRLSLNIPAHVKARIVSLRLDAATHPISGDRLASLALSGIASAWVFPHLSLPKRIVATFAFPLLAFAPKNFLASTLEPLFRDTKRGLAWRHRRRQAAPLPDATPGAV